MWSFNAPERPAAPPKTTAVDGEERVRRQRKADQENRDDDKRDFHYLSSEARGEQR